MVTTYRDQHHDVTDLEKGRAWCGSKPTMPLSESLRDTCDRVLPLFERGMAPYLRKGQTLLVVTHANACKALLRVLDPHVVIENVSFRRSRYPTRHTWCKPFSLAAASDDSSETIPGGVLLLYPRATNRDRNFGISEEDNGLKTRTM